MNLMKTILRRLHRLEGKLAPPVNLALQRLADELRERRRRRLEASGQPFDDGMPESICVPPGGRPMNSAEALRFYLEERRRAQRQARGEDE
jgi:hypothetical protein